MVGGESVTKTLVDVLKHAADECNNIEKRFIRIFKDHKQFYEIPYSLLYERAKKLATAFSGKGIKKNDYVIFQIGDMPEYLYTFWACEFIGAIPVPLPVNIRRFEATESSKKVNNVRTLLEGSFLIYGDSNASMYGNADERNINISKLMLKIDSYDSYEKENAEEDDIAFVQFSSGSTSNPKGVVLKHKNIIKNMEQISERLPLNGVKCCANWMPLTHDMGFIAFHLMPMKHSSNAILYSTELFMRNPLDFLKCVGETKSEFIGLSNSMIDIILKLMKVKKVDNLDLSALKFILNGSEPISCKSANLFLEVFKPYGLPENSMCYCYGMAEASLVVSVMEKSDNPSLRVNERDYYQEIITLDEDSEMEIPLVGKPLLDLEVIILDHNGVIRKENEIGEICIRGKNVMDGYLNIENNDFFTADGYFRTGDKGFLSDGKIAVIRRIKDIVFKNGVNYYSHDLERIVGEIYPEMINKCAAVQVNEKGKGNRIVLFINDAENADAKCRHINAEMVKKVGFMFEKFIQTDNFPRTMGGKIRRFKLADQYETEIRE